MKTEKKCKLKYLKIGDTFKYKNKDWIVLNDFIGDFSLCGRFVNDTYKVMQSRIDDEVFVYIDKKYYNQKICSRYVQDKISRNKI